MCTEVFFFDYLLTSSSEKASGVQTMQVFGVWSASPTDKLSDNNSWRAEKKKKHSNGNKSFLYKLTLSSKLILHSSSPWQS